MFFKNAPPVRLDRHSFRALRLAEKILVAEYEQAMAEFVQTRWTPSDPDQGPRACEKVTVSMRRLGTFLKSKVIPVDIAKKLGCV